MLRKLTMTAAAAAMFVAGMAGQATAGQAQLRLTGTFETNFDPNFPPSEGQEPCGVLGLASGCTFVMELDYETIDDRQQFPVPGDDPSFQYFPVDITLTVNDGVNTHVVT